MGKRQYATNDYDSDDGFEEEGRKSKKPKVGKPLNSAMQTDDEGNEFWELSGKRRVQISEFKGTTMVGVREYFEKDGKMLPGKKGISLSLDQYKSFITLLPDIERVLSSKGMDVPRPQYDAPAKSTQDDEEVDGDVSASKRRKKSSKPNHEATSDEDED